MSRRRGKLKIYMGYAAGVGKTYKMLEEAHTLKREGKDIVIGYFEPHGRQDTIAKNQGLEVIPRRKVEYRGATFEEMDTDRILARRPEICAVDEFPHTNVPGSVRKKRWEDVMVLLDASIDVLTTMNVQHLESLNDHVRHITGVLVRETVPDWTVQKADEVVMIDLTPRALLHRLERGVVYKGEQAQRALQNFFREPTLVALRELALREAAHEIGHKIADEEPSAQESEKPALETLREQKILVYLTPDPRTCMVIRRAKRVSDFLGIECFAVAVQAPGFSGVTANAQRSALETHLNFARNLHIEAHILEGNDAASLVIDFARRHHVTQIFVMRPHRGGFFARDPIQKMIAMAKDMEIVIVSDRDPVKRREL